MPVKVRQVIRGIERDGWVMVQQTGGHRQFKHPLKRGRVTVSGNSGKDVPPGTLRNILKQAGLIEDELK